MNYGAIYELDTANGIGCRTSVFVSGCTHHCKGCFNEKTWDFGYGKPYTDDVENYILSTLTEGVDGISVLGGEPMELVNQEAVYRLAFYTTLLGKTVWIYSGYTFEELTDPENKRCHGEWTDLILRLTDVLVDGEFKLEEKDISLQFRGSRNQRLIDVQKSLKKGEVVLWNECGS